MEKSIQITLIIVSAVVLLGLIGTYTILSISPVNSNTISSDGLAEVKVTPDLVSVYFTVDTNGTTAKEAKDKNSEISDALITSLVMRGFERKEITTESYNIYQDYVWGNGGRKDNGFKANHVIKVQISTSNTDKIGDVLDAGIDSGASFSYINFELSQALENQYKAQALEQATEDARIKAEAIASGLNRNLGGIVSVSTQSFDYSPWMAYSNAAGMEYDTALVKEAVATSIQPGERTISGRVSVVYKIR